MLKNETINRWLYEAQYRTDAPLSLDQIRSIIEKAYTQGRIDGGEVMRNSKSHTLRSHLDSLRVGDTVAVSNGIQAGEVFITAIMANGKMLVTSGVEPHRQMAFWRSNGEGVDLRQWKIIAGASASW